MESDSLLGPKDGERVAPVSGAGLWSRWQSFSSVCLYVSIVGTTYAYGVYSELLRSNLGFSQHGLDVVASVGNTGLYLSLLAGLALERFGLQVVIRGGGFLIFIGFLYIWAAVEGLVPANIASICVFFFLSQFGVCCHVSSSVTFAVRLFPPESRGIGVGLAKGYFGLSSAVLGDFAGGYFSSAPSSFLLFIALFIPLVGSVSSYFANLLPDSAVPFKIGETKSMLPYVIHWMVLFLVILSIGLLQFLTDLPGYADTISSTILMITLFSMVAIPGIYGPRFENTRNLHETSILRDTGTPRSIDKDDESDEEEQEFDLRAPQTQTKEQHSHSPLFLRDNLGAVHENSKSSDKEAELPQYSLGEVVFMWRFWAMYLIFLTMTGVGLMVIYNINAIASSVGKNPSTFFVTLVALANGMGRVLAGFISDRASKFVSKLELFSIVILCMAITQALHSIGSPTLLYPCLLSVGFLFGCTVSLMAINIADIFGGLHIATIFGLIDSAAISGTVVFAAGIVYLFYKESDGDDDYASNECFNTNCFRVPFIINASCCLIMFGLCLFVNSRVTPTKSSGH